MDAAIQGNIEAQKIEPSDEDDSSNQGDTRDQGKTNKQRDSSDEEDISISGDTGDQRDVSDEGHTSDQSGDVVVVEDHARPRTVRRKACNNRMPTRRVSKNKFLKEGKTRLTARLFNK